MRVQPLDVDAPILHGINALAISNSLGCEYRALPHLILSEPVAFAWL
jgi:hypothetical protein